MRYLTLLFVVLLSSSSFARTWTDIDGRTMEADFVKLSGETVTIRLYRDNRNYEVPITRFSQADRDYIASRIREENKSNVSATRKPTASVPEHLKDVRRVLVDAKGKRWSGEDPASCSYTLFYFSAHWCPPCQKFTPQLVSFYNDKKSGANFEIIFVSSDYSEGAMQTYMEELSMPWPGVKYSRLDNIDFAPYKGPGIPCLVLFDNEGELLSHSYVDGHYVGPNKVLRDLDALL